MRSEISTYLLIEKLIYKASWGRKASFVPRDGRNHLPSPVLVAPTHGGTTRLSGPGARVLYINADRPYDERTISRGNLSQKRRVINRMYSQRSQAQFW